MADFAAQRLEQAVSSGRWRDPSAAEEARVLIEDWRFDQALECLEAAAELEQSSLFWFYMRCAAEELGLRDHTRRYELRDAAVYLNEAAAEGRFSDPAAAGRARRLVDGGDFEQAFDVLEAAAEPDQEGSFWSSMEMAALTCGLEERRQAYFSKAHGTPETAGPSEQEQVTKSTMSVAEGMSRIIDVFSERHPHPDWERFRALDVEGDLQHLKGWLESVLASEPPGPEVPGFWFGLVNPIRAGLPTADIYVCGSPHGPDDEDWGYRTGWEPSGRYARSAVLDGIYRVSYPSFRVTADSSEADKASYRNAMEALLGNTAEYQLALAYGGLVVRCLANELEPELLLSGASERVLFVGFDDGDFLCVGAVTQQGLRVSKETERMA